MGKSSIAYLCLLLILGSCSSEEKSEKTTEISHSESEKELPKIKYRPFESNTIKDSSNWEFKEIKGSKIYFKGGQTFETNLYELAYIDQIRTDKKAPFLIYSGRDCDECDAHISLYFHSPRNGELAVAHGQNRNSFPGKELDYETDSLLTETQVFYGEVLNGKMGMIWYQRFLLEKGGFGKGIYLSSIEGDTIYGREIKNYDQKLIETLALNKAGKNKEIKGQVYHSEP